MTTPWLHIIGIGEDGLAGLSLAAQTVLQEAAVIIGAERHHGLTDGFAAKRMTWPSPFSHLLDQLSDLRGQRVAVLVTGDPLWYSAGARIGRQFSPQEVMFFPQIGAFQLAASRLGWSMADLETLTLHGRPVASVANFIAPDARLLMLTTGAQTPGEVAEILVDNGYGTSQMTVFAAMGGAREAQFSGTAATWDHVVPDFNTLAVTCIAGPEARLAPRTPGLRDDLFVSDGTMTKQEVRAASVAKLMPMRGAHLWDIGCGSGSVAIEWMRSARDATAVGIESRDDRRVMAAQNATALGVPRLKLVGGDAPEALQGLATPDAVFIGGGFTRAVFDIAWNALRKHGRLVVNSVTLESEALMLALYAEFGGDLVKIAVQRAAPVGRLTGWRPAMTVTQWSLVKL